jgi:hypothetical protein
MNAPPGIEDDYIAEFNARRKYAPESVITFTDFGIPELTENMVRNMIASGKIILSNFENIKICAMGHIIRRIHGLIANNTQSYNMIRSVLSLKDCNADEFMRRKDMMYRLIDSIVEEAITDEPQSLDEPRAPTIPNEPKAKKPKKKESTDEKPKPTPKEPKDDKKPKEPKPKEPKPKEPKPKAPKEPTQKGGEPKAEGEIKAKKQSIPKKVKDDVWNTYIGEGIAKHKCLCCKMTTIDKAKFDCGHVISEKNGGTLSIRNLRPVCNGCNLSMSSENMIDYVKKHEYYIG